MDIAKALSEQADLIRNKVRKYRVGKDVIEIKQITVGQVIAISPYLAQIQIEGEINTPEEFEEKAMPQLTKYTDPLRKIFNEVVDYDFDKLLPIDVSNIFLLILMQDCSKDFMNATTFATKLSRTMTVNLVALQKDQQSSTLSI